MRYFLALLLALAMTANADASSAAQSGLCCSNEECPVVQCIEMGCLPGLSPLAAQDVSRVAAGDVQREMPVELTFYLHNRYKEIWSPPD